MALSFLKRQVKKRDRVVAIDLGAHSTKAVVVQNRSDRFSLVDFAVVEAPKGEMTAEVVSAHLKEVTDQMDLGRSKLITLAVGVSETLFRQVDVPLMPVADLRLMLKFNSKNYLQQDLQNHVFDACYMAGRAAVVPDADAKPGQQKHRALVGGIRRQLIDDLSAASKLAGLSPDQVVPSLVGPANALEMSDPQSFAKDVVALVDIGFKHTSITIMNAGEISLNRVVAIGGDRLTQVLAETMNISYLEAENIKVGMAWEVQAALEGAVNPLGRELRASIDFFEHQQDKAVGQVLLSGGTSRNEIIMQALQTELLVPCKLWSPVESMELNLPPQKMGQVEQVGSRLMIAIGAAASGF